MDSVLRWISDNVDLLLEVLLGGAGVAVIGGLIRWLFLRQQNNGATQHQSSGDNSTNLQSGRDISIGGQRRDDEKP